MDLAVFRVFAEALAVGLLIGVERYKSRVPGEGGAAGVRTFAVFSLLGAVCSIIGQPLFTLSTFILLGILIVISYFRSSVEAPGMTTEVSALLTFWIGFLVRDYEILAVSSAIILTILLALKQTLHRFVRDAVSELEFLDTLKFLAVVLVIYPLLPDRAMGPYGFFNPSTIWLLVMLVSTISYGGYVMVRILGSTWGLRMNALVGGLVSTTAVTVSLAERARRSPPLSSLLAGAALLANSVQAPRLLVLVLSLNLSLAGALTVPFLGLTVLGLAGTVLLTRKQKREHAAPVGDYLTNPYAFWPALKFGLLFAAVMLLTSAAQAWMGDRGVFFAGILSGMVSSTAAVLSLANLVNSGSLSVDLATWAVLLVIAANALVKWVLSLVNGTKSFGLWLGLGFAAMVVCAAVLVWLTTAVPV